ncbi:MAG: YggT family protein [Hyphomicrobiales bacterium]
MGDNPFLSGWYFHLPNYLLAALMYSLIARLLLSFFFPPDAPNYINRAFVRLTDPVLALVAPLTPRAVPPRLVVLFAALWVLLARFVFLAGLASAGLAPTIAAG